MRSRVLYISGHPEDASKLSAMLHALPLVVNHAESVRQARAQLPLEEYDAVLTEASLPDGNWLDVLHLVRESPREIAVVVTDAQADTRLWAEIIHLGAYDLLPQPFDKAEVRRILTNACSRLQSAAAV
jgi:DNA-binding NtrC family response regulator